MICRRQARLHVFAVVVLLGLTGFIWAEEQRPVIYVPGPVQGQTWAPTVQAALALRNQSRPVIIAVQSRRLPNNEIPGFLVRGNGIEIQIDNEVTVTSPISIVNAEDVILSGGAAAMAILIDNSKRVKVFGVRADGGMFINNSEEVDIARCRFIRRGGTGLLVQNCMRGERRELSKNWNQPAFPGGTVIIRDCTFKDLGRGAGVLASASHLRVVRSTFEDLNGRGVVVQNSSVAFVDGHFKNVTGVGVSFRDSDGRIEPIGIHGVRSDGGLSRGVEIMSTADPASRARVRVSTFITGVQEAGMACFGGEVELSGMIQGGQMGVMLAQGATGLVKVGVIINSTEAAIGMLDPGPVVLENISLRSNPGFGLAVGRSPDVTIRNVEMKKSPPQASYRQPMRVDNGRPVGGAAFSQSNVKAERLRVESGGAGPAIQLSDGTVLESKGASATSSGGDGLTVVGSTFRGKFWASHNRGRGVRIGGGSQVTLDDPLVQENMEGGILVDGQSSLTCQGGKVLGYHDPTSHLLAYVERGWMTSTDEVLLQPYSLELRGGSTAEINETYFEHAPRALIRVADGGRVTVSGSWIREDRVLNAAGYPSWDGPLDGVSVDGGNATLENCKFDVQRGDGVRVFNGGRAVVSGASFEHSGVIVEANAEAEVRNCTFAPLTERANIHVLRGGRLDESGNRVKGGSTVKVVNEN